MMEKNLSNIFFNIISVFSLKRKICSSLSYKFYIFLYLFKIYWLVFGMIKHSERFLWNLNDIKDIKDYILHKFRLGHSVTDVAKHTYSVYTWQSVLW